jgi:dTDP-L-rhamnose 4-epimerase
VTKRDQEKLCLTVGCSYGIPTRALRFFNVYGPGQSLANPYTGVVAIFASRLLSGEVPLIFEDGAQTRDFIHVLDVVNACVQALEGDVAGFALNIGTGRPVSVFELAQKLRGILGGPEPRILNRYRAGDIRHCVADVSMAERVLGWQATITLEEGLYDLTDWLRNQKGNRTAIQRALSELQGRGLVW